MPHRKSYVVDRNVVLSVFRKMISAGVELVRDWGYGRLYFGLMLVWVVERVRFYPPYWHVGKHNLCDWPNQFHTRNRWLNKICFGWSMMPPALVLQEDLFLFGPCSWWRVIWIWRQTASDFNTHLIDNHTLLRILIFLGYRYIFHTLSSTLKTGFSIFLVWGTLIYHHSCMRAGTS